MIPASCRSSSGFDSFDNRVYRLQTSGIPIIVACLTVFGCWMIAAAGGIAAADDGPIPVQSAFLTLESEVEVPAREAGVLRTVAVELGDEVAAGDLLARIDDQSARLLARKAELELAIAEARAQSDAAVRLCQEELRVAEIKLARGTDSKNRFDVALSDSELDQLKLEVAKKKIELEEALLEQSNARKQQQLSGNALDLANALRDRHQIVSPLEGTVVEINRQPGEWVKPGDAVFRVVGLKSLRVVGFIDARRATPKLVGQSVLVVYEKGTPNEVTRQGKVLFVSPQIDPINQQVKIMATVPNEDKKMSPGQRVEMSVDPPAIAGR